MSESKSTWRKRMWIDDSVEVECSAEALFVLLKDIDRWPTWTPGLAAVKRKTQEELRAGAKFTMVLETKLIGKIPLPCELFEIRPDLIEWGGGALGAKIRHRFELQAIGAQRTRLRHTEYATGFLGWVTLPIERFIHAHDHAWTETIVKRFAKAA